MPAIIMHAGAGVLLIIMTNFASYKQKNKNKNKKKTIPNHKSQNQTSPLSNIHIPNINNTKSAPKTNITTNTPLHTTNLLPRSSTSK